MKWMVVALVGVLGVGIVLVGWHVFSGYRGWERYTIVRSGNGRISVESFDPKTGKGIRIKLPEQLEMDTVGGRGVWRISALLKLVDKYGERWLVDSVADNLGVLYQKYNPLLWWWYGRSVDWKDIDMEESGLVREVVLPDGVKALELSGNWHEVADDYFFSLELSSQTIDVEVVNTTGEIGLAAHAERAIVNSGLRVIMLSEQDTQIPGRCVIVAGPVEAKSKPVWYLSTKMGCSVQDGDMDDDKIRVLIGKKYQEWWKGD